MSFFFIETLSLAGMRAEALTPGLCYASFGSGKSFLPGALTEGSGFDLPVTFVPSFGVGSSGIGEPFGAK